ncbi:hypothetical protein KPY62_00540 [Psychrobacter sp. TAE2020]|nr:hypothetical protein [Psychrobacter sp. TAE2020]
MSIHQACTLYNVSKTVLQCWQKWYSIGLCSIVIDIKMSFYNGICVEMPYKSDV